MSPHCSFALLVFMSHRFLQEKSPRARRGAFSLNLSFPHLTPYRSTSQLVTTTLRRDPTSYFSLCPLDVLEYLVAPMVKNMRGFKLPSPDDSLLGAEAQLYAAAAISAPVVKSQ